MQSVAALLLAVALSAFSSGEANATVPADLGSISISIDGPPDQRSLIGVRLEREGSDVTDAACRTLDQQGPTEILCTDLEAGTYSIELGGAQPNMIVSTRCADSVATPADFEAIAVGAADTQFSCSIRAAEPSILIRGQYNNPFDPTLLDSNGAPVDCVADDYDTAFGPVEILNQRRWCPTPPGRYRIDRDSIDPVFVDDLFCLGGVLPVGEDPLDPLDPYTEIEIDGSQPWAACDQSSVAPVRVEVRWSGEVDQTAPWFDSLRLALTDQSGQVTDCDVVDAFAEPGSNASRFECDVFFGDFTAEFFGIPDDASFPDFDSSPDGFDRPNESPFPCGVIENRVNLQGSCVLQITTPAVADPADTELPATGRTTTPMLVIGFGLLVLGLALLAGTKQRLL